MAKLRGSKLIVDEIVNVMRQIDEMNEECSSYTNYSVGIANFLYD